MDTTQNTSNLKSPMQERAFGPLVLLSITLLGFVFHATNSLQYAVGLIFGKVLISAAFTLPLYLLIRYAPSSGRVRTPTANRNTFCLLTAAILAAQLILLAILPNMMAAIGRNSLANTSTSEGGGTEYSQTGPQTNQAKRQKIITTEADQAAEIKLLTENHPDWREVTASPAFEQWKAQQPKDVQDELSSTWDSTYLTEKLTEFKQATNSRTSAR